MRPRIGLAFAAAALATASLLTGTAGAADVYTVYMSVPAGPASTGTSSAT
jgi:hypothetical protein